MTEKLYRKKLWLVATAGDITANWQLWLTNVEVEHPARPEDLETRERNNRWWKQKQTVSKRMGSTQRGKRREQSQLFCNK